MTSTSAYRSILLLLAVLSCAYMSGCVKKEANDGMTAQGHEFVTLRGNTSPINLVWRLAPGARRELTLVVNESLAQSSHFPLDVLLLLDNTGSMDSIIENVKKRAAQFVRDVQKEHPGSRFAVATVADYDDPAGKGKPWVMEQPFTESPEQVAQAVGRIVTVDSSTAAEAYVRGLYEAQFIGWRGKTHKFIVFFGDSVPKDPDPGRDGQLGTADDLGLSIVLTSLRQQDLRVFPVFDLHRWPDLAVANTFEGIAQSTSGFAYSLDEADQATGRLLQAVTRAASLRPEVLDPYKPWVSINKEVHQGEDYLFPLAINPPQDAKLRNHELLITLGNGKDRLGEVNLLLILGRPWGILLIVGVLLLPALLAALAYVHRRARTGLLLGNAITRQAALLFMALIGYAVIMWGAWQLLVRPWMPVIWSGFWF